MFATMRSFSSQADESALSLRERARAEGARVRVSGFDHTATLTGLNNMLERNWLPEAEARGYIIVSPIAPPNHFFFEQGADAVFPEFLALIEGRYSGDLSSFAASSNGGGRYAPMTLHVKLHSEFACQNQRRIEVFVVQKRMRR